jgi:hypothetical protein
MKASINEDLATALDPVHFARTVGIDPDEWQQKLLLSSEKRIILNCSRQSGKSTIVALLSLHHALNHPAALVLVLSPSLRQSSELFKKIISFYSTLGQSIPADVQTALTLQLKNESRIISLPAKEQTVRGFSGASLLVIDEASLVPEDLYYAVLPMLAISQGRLILLSTPHGKRGFFYEAYVNGGPAWERYKVTADECPRISAEFLEEERKTLGQYWYSQEFECVFHQAKESIFRLELIEASIGDFEELDVALDDDEEDSDVEVPIIDGSRELHLEHLDDLQE